MGKNSEKHYKDKIKKKRILKDIRNNTFCSICGRQEGLTFHHRDRKDKIGNISDLVHRGSVGRFIREIQKCELMCDKCHIEHERVINKELSK